jgi:hypothetical protein
MTDIAAPPALIAVEDVLWTPGAEWEEAIRHLAGRFARVVPLDADAILGLGSLEAQLAALEAWAQEAGADLDRELGRWFDEHLSMHVRPNPSVTRSVRAVAAARPLVAYSTLPPRVAEAIARHAGAWRSFAELVAPVRTTEELREVVRARGATLVIAPQELGDALEGVATSELAAAVR